MAARKKSGYSMRIRLSLLLLLVRIKQNTGLFNNSTSHFGPLDYRDCAACSTIKVLWEKWKYEG
jgi:hypothetical protein